MIRDAPPKLKRVRRLDCIRLDAKDATYFTEEGYLVDHPVLTSVGIFEYSNPDGSIRRELRLPEHVFAPESLKSYRGKPIIITHDAGIVDKDNVDREQIGTILSDGYQDGDDVRAEIIIHNTDKMMDCGLRELSLGYDLDLVEEPGEWEGEPYDAIQTNIVINHLALVASARAGKQARLNIDGSDEPELKGGKAKMLYAKKADAAELTPEQLQEAVDLWKEKNSNPTAGEDSAPDDEKKKMDSDDDAEGVPAPGTTVEDKLASIKKRRDRRGADGEPDDLKDARAVIGQQDEDIDVLMACLEKLLAENGGAKAETTDKKDGTVCKTDDDDDPWDDTEDAESEADSSDDEGKSLNADSADDIIRQRLSICRVGDKLHMDGLENKSILEGKKAIVAKVFPSLRLDGQNRAYVDACYDLAVGEISKRKDVNYQRRQMSANPPQNRADSAENVSMAAAARRRMIEHEGGNE